MIDYSGTWTPSVQVPSGSKLERNYFNTAPIISRWPRRNASGVVSLLPSSLIMGGFMKPFWQAILNPVSLFATSPGLRLCFAVSVEALRISNLFPLKKVNVPGFGDSARICREISSGVFSQSICPSSVLISLE